MRVRALAGLALSAVALSGQAAPPRPAAPMALWRLECGGFDLDFSGFSDTGRYDGQHRKLVDSCYLVKHGSDYLLWDTGLPKKRAGQFLRDGEAIAPEVSIVSQLARIGVAPAQVRYVGISHYHDDHTGQADDFPAATLLIGKSDWEAAGTGPGRGNWPNILRPWRSGKAKIEALDGDKDVFGDGSVTMLAMPGHTPGHHALLVKLPKTGAVLLSGDQFHAAESLKYDQVPSFNVDRADTLASSARFREIAANRRARIIVQHEPADVAKLPIFPRAAD